MRHRSGSWWGQEPGWIREGENAQEGWSGLGCYNLGLGAVS